MKYLKTIGVGQDTNSGPEHAYSC